jgi:hypothetical protein
MKPHIVTVHLHLIIVFIVWFFFTRGRSNNLPGMTRLLALCVPLNLTSRSAHLSWKEIVI